MLPDKINFPRQVIPLCSTFPSKRLLLLLKSISNQVSLKVPARRSLRALRVCVRRFPRDDKIRPFKNGALIFFTGTEIDL